VDGDADLFARVEALGVNTIKPVAWADDYPVSAAWPEKIPSLYADLQIPRLFPEHERAVWIDADCVVVKPLTGLLEINFNQPIAACSPPGNNYTLGFVLRECPGGHKEKRSPFGGLIIFNIPEWNRRGLTEKCAEAMLNKDITFRYGDQSVLAYVLLGDFFILPLGWQTWANRKLPIPANARILHWVGVVPWLNEVNNKHRWLEYADPRQ
jgi:lipopolysaccharide biosynthesis glycosyltransferase